MRRKHLLGAGVERSVSVVVDGEQIDDQPAPRVAAPRRQAFRPALVAEHLPGADVEPAGGHGAGDEGEGALQVVADQQNVGADGAARHHPHVQRVLAVNGRHQLHVGGDLYGGEQREIVVVQLLEEVIQHLGRHLRTTVRHLGAQ